VSFHSTEAYTRGKPNLYWTCYI